MESGSCLLFWQNCNQACEQAAPAMMTHPSVSSGWTQEWVAVVKSHDCLHSVKMQPGVVWCSREGWDEQGRCVQSVHAASTQASMGLDTMLFGVSGS